MKTSPEPSNENRVVYDTDRGDLRKMKTQSPEETDHHGPKPKMIQKVRVVLDTKQRRGKAVTCILGIQHNPQVIEELAVTLKRLCGAGGTVKGKTIEIQGDHREKIIGLLTDRGYVVTK